MAVSKKQEPIDHEAVVRRFGERLKEVRREKGMTQADLAEKTSITASYIGRLERAGAAPGIDLVARLASALGSTISHLLPEADPPDQAPVIREQARKLFEKVVESDDVVTLQLLAQFLARIAETTPSAE